MKTVSYPTPEVLQPVVKPIRQEPWPTHHHTPADQTEDHFIERDGVVFAGSHLILDFWGAKRLDNLQLMEDALRECVRKSLATLLHIHLHHFTPNGGISGVAVLAESHISVHTWPEREFAAFDIFMCGKAKPEESISVLKRAFTPRTMKISENLRGIIGND
ncbi:adenosylmethionine decarboxylase [Desulfobacula sp.]|uniref:adenosylmethionine decarboxylase n=1 Tax=Desulfobacula sp. TaxID=2593537 RepID=UPI0026372300|nr:adenosylmethionine decarboxylase [Desulfobacula sp.]